MFSSHSIHKGKGPISLSERYHRVRTVMENLEKSRIFKMVISNISKFSHFLRYMPRFHKTFGHGYLVSSPGNPLFNICMDPDISYCVKCGFVL